MAFKNQTFPVSTKINLWSSLTDNLVKLIWSTKVKLQSTKIWSSLTTPSWTNFLSLWSSLRSVNDLEVRWPVGPYIHWYAQRRYASDTKFTHRFINTSCNRSSLNPCNYLWFPSQTTLTVSSRNHYHNRIS